MQILDTPGLDAYKLYVTETSIIRESTRGQEDIMMFTDSGGQSIEYLEWVADPQLEPDYKNHNGEIYNYTHALRIVTDTSEITDAYFAYAGTMDNDTIIIPNGLSIDALTENCLLYTSPSPRDPKTSRMPSSA